jgi:hypothetical protein
MKLKHFILLIIFSGTTTLAQQMLSQITWEVGFPAGHTSEFLSKTSFAGFGLDYGKFLDQSGAVKLHIGWNLFEERVEDPINFSKENISGTISGVQIRSINIFPIFVGYNYYLGNRRETRPFIGMNVGTYWIGQRLDIGVYRFQADYWHFGIAPEFGFMIPVSRSTDFVLMGRYNYAFDAGTGADGRENNFYAYWNIGIGFISASLF